MPQDIQSKLNETCQLDLQDIEQKRNDALPEQQRMQKRSPKIQSIQDKKRNMHKESVAAEEEMRRVREEMNKREERFHQRSKKSELRPRLAGRRGKKRHQRLLSQ